MGRNTLQQRDDSDGSQYTGQINDGDTGLYYYNARYYDPALHRFIQADTIVPDPNDPQTLNRFAYVNNNPIKYTDPTGHDADCSPNDTGCTEQWTLEQWMAEGVVFDLEMWYRRFDGKAKLQIIIDSLNAILARYGANQVRNFLYSAEKGYQHLEIVLNTGISVNGNAQGELGLIRLDDGFRRATVVHEFGHIVDYRAGSCADFSMNSCNAGHAGGYWTNIAGWSVNEADEWQYTGNGTGTVSNYAWSLPDENGNLVAHNDPREDFAETFVWDVMKPQRMRRPSPERLNALAVARSNINRKDR